MKKRGEGERKRNERGREEEKKPTRLTPANVIPGSLVYKLPDAFDESESACKLGGRVRGFLLLLMSGSLTVHFHHMNNQLPTFTSCSDRCNTMDS